LKESINISEKVDLPKFLFQVFDGWVKVIIFIFFTVSIFFFFFKDNTFVSRTPLSPLFNDINEEFIEINLILDESSKFYSKNNRLDEKKDTFLEFKKFSNKTLFDDFLKIITRKENLQKIAIKSGIFKKSDFKDETSYRKAVLEFVSSISIAKSVDIDIDIDLNSTILIQKYHDIDKWIHFLDFLKREINFLITSSNIKLLQMYLNQIRSYEESEIAKLVIKKNILNEKNILKTKSDISKLNNFSEIARSNNIEFGKNLTTLSPYYLRGYKVIDQEIEFMEKTFSTELFDDSLQNIHAQELYLLQNSSHKKLKKLISKLEENLINSKKINFDINMTEISFADNKIKFIISIFLGMVIGVFFVYTEASIKEYKESLKTKS